MSISIQIRLWSSNLEIYKYLIGSLMPFVAITFFNDWSMWWVISNSSSSNMNNCSNILIKDMFSFWVRCFQKGICLRKQVCAVDYIFCKQKFLYKHYWVITTNRWRDYVIIPFCCEIISKDVLSECNHVIFNISTIGEPSFVNSAFPTMKNCANIIWELESKLHWILFTLVFHVVYRNLLYRAILVQE